MPRRASQRPPVHTWRWPSGVMRRPPWAAGFFSTRPIASSCCSAWRMMPPAACEEGSRRGGSQEG